MSVGQSPQEPQINATGSTADLQSWEDLNPCEEIRLAIVHGRGQVHIAESTALSKEVEGSIIQLGLLDLNRP